MRDNAARAVLLASIIAISAVLAACGSSSGSSTKATTTTSAASTVPSTTTTTLPKIKAKRGGAFCTELANLLSSENAQTTTDTSPASMRAEFTSSQRAITQATTDAPSAIKSQLQILQTAIDSENAALVKVDYDVTKLGVNGLAGFSTPAVQQAGVKVAAFVRQKCGIDIGGGAGTIPSTTTTTLP